MGAVNIRTTIVIAFAVVSAVGQVQPESIAWEKDLSAGKKLAVQEKRPLILYFTFDT